MQDLFLLSEEEVKQLEDKLYSEYNVTEEHIQELRNLLNEYKNSLDEVLLEKRGLIKEKSKNIRYLSSVSFISIMALLVNMVFLSSAVYYLLSILFLISIPSIWKIVCLLLNDNINNLEKESITLRNKIFTLKKEEEKLDNNLKCITYKLDNIKDTRRVLEDINSTLKGKEKLLVRTRKII